MTISFVDLYFCLRCILLRTYLITGQRKKFKVSGNRKYKETVSTVAVLLSLKSEVASCTVYVFVFSLLDSLTFNLQ